MNPVREPEPGALKILFIGNSYTYYNDFPAMLEYCVDDIDEYPPLFVEAVVMGGASLKNLWDEGIALQTIRERDWDFVVLQEGTAVPFVEPEMMDEYIRKFDDEIEKEGAATLLFLTWANQNSPEMQVMLDTAYFSIADVIDADVVPAGPAWQRALSLNPLIQLYALDTAHPGKRGTFLNVCVFYAYLYDKKPEGFPRSLTTGAGYSQYVTEEESEFLGQVAWDTVQEYIAASQ
ncbi:hypothetical protein ACFL6I_04330 [candidate division KSB1 bacterium]